MNLQHMQMWRVRHYDHGRFVTHSFRVAAESKSRAIEKVSEYLEGVGVRVWQVDARPAGKQTFWK